MHNLEYSRYLDTQKVTEHPKLVGVLDVLLAELGLADSAPATGETRRGLRYLASERVGSERLAQPINPLPPLRVRTRDLALYRWHAKRILLDLWEAAWVDREGWLRYHRNRNAYGPKRVLHARGFKYDPVFNITNAIRPADEKRPNGLGWVEHAIGFYPRDKDEDGQRPPGKLSRMRATDKLLKRFGEIERGWIQHEPLPYLARIVVKNKDKERIPPPDEEQAERLRSEVLRTQALADGARAELRLPPDRWKEFRKLMREGNDLVDLTPTSLYRVFNDGQMDMGGRYYGPAYQGIPSKLRCWYYLNGEPTVELDYKCLHPSMLYAEAGELIPVDCYDLPGYDSDRFRSLIKRGLNVYINAKTRGKAVNSLVYRWKRERTPFSGIREDKRIWAGLTEVESMARAREVSNALLDDLERHHQPIAHKFGSDEGKRLQGLDASIAGRVLSETSSIHCPVMIFHDGFRVIYGEAEKVWSIMRSEFRVRFHQDIRVEAKGATPPLSVPTFSDVDANLLHRLSAINAP